MSFVVPPWNQYQEEWQFDTFFTGYYVVSALTTEGTMKLTFDKTSTGRDSGLNALDPTVTYLEYEIYFNKEGGQNVLIPGSSVPIPSSIIRSPGWNYVKITDRVTVNGQDIGVGNPQKIDCWLITNTTPVPDYVYIDYVAIQRAGDVVGGGTINLGNVTGVLPVQHGGTAVTISTGRSAAVLNVEPVLKNVTLEGDLRLVSNALTIHGNVYTDFLHGNAFGTYGIPLANTTGVLPRWREADPHRTGTGNVLVANVDPIISNSLTVVGDIISSNIIGNVSLTNANGLLPVSAGGTGTTFKTGTGAVVLNTNAVFKGTTTMANVVANFSGNGVGLHTLNVSNATVGVLAVEHGGTGVTTKTGTGNVVLSDNPVLNNVTVSGGLTGNVFGNIFGQSAVLNTLTAPNITSETLFANTSVTTAQLYGNLVGQTSVVDTLLTAPNITSETLFANTSVKTSQLYGNLLGQTAVVDQSITTPTLTVSNNADILGNLSVFGNLVVASGNVVYIDSEIRTSEQIIVDNAGDGAALIVKHSGAQPIMEAQDDGNVVFKIYDEGSVAFASGLDNRLNDTSTAPTGALVSVLGNVSVSQSIDTRHVYGNICGQTAVMDFLVGDGWQVSNIVPANVVGLVQTLEAANANILTLSSNVNVLSANTDALSCYVRTNIDTLSSNVDTLSSNVDTLSSNVDTLSANTDALSSYVRSNIDTLSSNADTLSSNVDTLSANTDALSSYVRSNIDTLSSNVDTLSSNVDTLSSNVDTLSANTDALSSYVRSNIDTLSSNVDTLSSNVDTLSSNVDTLSSYVRSNIDTLSSNVDTLSSNIDTLSSNVDTLSANTDALSSYVRSNIDTLSSNVDTLSSNVDTLSSNVDTLSSNVDTLSANTDALSSYVRSNIDTLSSNVDTLSSNIDTLSSNVDTLSANTDALSSYVRSNIDTLSSNVDTLSSNVDTLSSNVDTLSANTDALSSYVRSNIDTLSSNIDTLSSNVDTLSSNVDTLSSNVDTLSANTDALSSYVRSNIDTLSSNVDTLSSNVDTLSANTDALSSYVRSNIDTLSSNVDTLSSNVDTLSANTDALSSYVRSNIDTLSTTVQGYTDTFTTGNLYATVLADLPTTIADSLTVRGNTRLQGNLIIDSGNVVYVESQVDISEQLVVHNQGTGPAVDVLQTGAESLARFVDDGNVVMQMYNWGNVAFASGHSDILNNTTQSPSDALVTVFGSFAADTIRGNISSSNVIGLDTSISDLWANAGDQQTEIIGLQSDTANLWSNAASQQTAIDDLQANAEAQQTDLIDLWSNAASQQTAIDDLQANAGAQQTDLIDLWSNAASQQTAIGDLQANTGSQQTEITGLLSDTANLWSNAQAQQLEIAQVTNDLSNVFVSLDTGTVTANVFIGDGSQLTNVGSSNASLLTEGTLSQGRLPTTIGNVSTTFIGDGSQLLNVGSSNASLLTEGTLSQERLPTTIGNASTTYYGDGGFLSNVSATVDVSNLDLIITSGYIEQDFDVLGNLTGNLVLANTDGTATAPAYAFRNDLGTGLYLGSNALGIAVDSTALATVSSDGLTVNGNISGAYILGNGALLEGVASSNASSLTEGVISQSVLPQTLGNALTDFVGNSLDVTGNVSGSYILGNGALLEGVASSNASSLTEGVISQSVLPQTLGNALTDFVGNSLDVTGNVSGSYILGNGALLEGVASSNASSLPEGVISQSVLPQTLGNALTDFVGNSLDVTGNVSGSYILGNGGLLEGMASSNASSLTEGVISQSVLPQTLGNTLTSFVGNGYYLESLNAAALTGNIDADVVLDGNVDGEIILEGEIDASVLIVGGNLSIGVPILLENGSATEPMLSFNHATTTGVYLETGNLGISANGSGVLTVTPTALVPQSNSVYDLGSSTHMFGSLYLSGNTLYLGNVVLKDEDGALSTSAQLVGDGSGLANIVAGNITGLTQALDVIQATSVTANVFAGNGAGLDSLIAANITGLTDALDVIQASSVDANVANVGNISIGNVVSDIVVDGEVTTTGNVFAGGNITAFASDKRLKSNIQPIQNAVELIKKLHGYTFTWRDDIPGLPMRGDDIGLLAQELQDLGLDQCVSPAPFDLDQLGHSRSGEQYLTIHYNKLFAVVIQALHDIIDAMAL